MHKNIYTQICEHQNILRQTQLSIMCFCLSICFSFIFTLVFLHHNLFSIKDNCVNLAFKESVSLQNHDDYRLHDRSDCEV